MLDRVERYAEPILPIKGCSRLIALTLLLLEPTAIFAQTPIVLRDLSLIREVEVADFDEREVRLSDGRRLGWDEVLKAQVESPRQAEFDQYLERVGLPLFRLKSRVKNQDWSGIGEVAEPMYQALGDSNLKDLDRGPTIYLICFATMKGRLHRGDRPGAVLPFLQAAFLQHSAEAAGDTTIPKLLPVEDAQTMLSSEILPIWFDQSLVEDAFNSLSRSFVVTPSTDEIGAVIYLLSMAIALERTELSKELLKLIQRQAAEFESWKLVLQAQFEISMGNHQSALRLLESKRSVLTGPARAMAMYVRLSRYFQQRETDDRTQRDDEAADTEDAYANAMLELLRIPAEYGDRFPDLSAAAIYQSAQIAETLGWSNEHRLLIRELLLKFPVTFHARDIEKRNGFSQN